MVDKHVLLFCLSDNSLLVAFFPDCRTVYEIRSFSSFKDHVGLDRAYFGCKCLRFLNSAITIRLYNLHVAFNHDTV